MIRNAKNGGQNPQVDINVGRSRYNIILAYRAGGPPTYIEDLCISGPANYQSTFHNLVGIRSDSIQFQFNFNSILIQFY